MRRLAIVSALSLAGCTQILGLDDAVIEPPEQTVAVPPFDAVVVDGGRQDADASDARSIDAAPDVASEVSKKD